MKPATELKVSIVIPVYNAEQFLEEALQSVLSQTRVPNEIIVIDDGSNDRSFAVASSFSDVRCIQTANNGPAAARNRGIKESRYECIAFHDADDICDPSRIERQVARLEQNPLAQYCVCRIQNFVQANQNIAPELLRDQLLEPRDGFVSAGVFRRSVFTTVGYFDESYRHGEDVEWLYRAQRANTIFETCPEVLVQRRLHENNISREFKEGHRNLFRMIREAKE